MAKDVTTASLGLSPSMTPQYPTKAAIAKEGDAIVKARFSTRLGWPEEAIDGLIRVRGQKRWWSMESLIECVLRESPEPALLK